MIEIIRNEDEPKPALMSRFGISETEAESDSRTETAPHLAKLEEMKIRGEQDELEKKDQLRAFSRLNAK